ncbi:MAG: TIM barrel protein [Planctomycetes bacterium]|nr:TIM barrel protein [Planctomycetota bacterium]
MTIESTRRRFLQLGLASCASSALNPLAVGSSRCPAPAPRSSRLELALNIEMWLSDRPFTDRIAKAKEMGFNHVEFWPWRNKNLGAIADACAQHQVKITQFTAWGFNPGMNNPQNHKKFVDEITAACDAAKQIGAPMMTVVAGNDQHGMSQTEMHDHVITGLNLVKDIAAENEIMLILEPMNIRRDHHGHCLYGSEGALRICRAVDSPWVKINWDLYHMQISEGDLCGHLNEGFDQVGYIQLADHPGRHEPGTGEINYSRVLKELVKLGYNKPIGVECSPSIAAEDAAANMFRNLELVK